MTRARRGEKTYIGFNGAPTDRMRELVKLAKTPAGGFGRLAAPSAGAVRMFIKAQLCPWCGEGPYKVLAIHTHSAHGVSAAELRELAGVIKTASICSEEVSADKRERLLGKRLPDSAYTTPRKPRSFSSAGLSAQRSKLDQARSPEQQQAATAASAARTISRNGAIHARIIDLFAAGLPLTDIAVAVGCCQATVRRALRRSGLWEGDGRAIRWQRASADDVAAMREQFTQARERQAQHASEARIALVKEFGATGGDFSAVREMARRRGISVKSMTERLRNAGVTVPDGRLAARSRLTDADRIAMREMYLTGSSQSEVGRQFGVNQAYVSTILSRMGVKTRPFARA